MLHWMLTISVVLTFPRNGFQLSLRRNFWQKLSKDGAEIRTVWIDAFDVNGDKIFIFERCKIRSDINSFPVDPCSENLKCKNGSVEVWMRKISSSVLKWHLVEYSRTIL